MMRALQVAVCVAVLAAAGAAAAREIDVPLRLDHEFIRQILLERLYTSPSGQAVVWDTGKGATT